MCCLEHRDRNRDTSLWHAAYGITHAYADSLPDTRSPVHVQGEGARQAGGVIGNSAVAHSSSRCSGPWQRKQCLNLRGSEITAQRGEIAAFLPAQ